MWLLISTQTCYPVLRWPDMNFNGTSVNTAFLLHQAPWVFLNLILTAFFLLIVDVPCWYCLSASSFELCGHPWSNAHMNASPATSKGCSSVVIWTACCQSTRMDPTNKSCIWVRSMSLWSLKAHQIKGSSFKWHQVVDGLVNYCCSTLGGSLLRT